MSYSFIILISNINVLFVQTSVPHAGTTTCRLTDGLSTLLGVVLIRALIGPSNILHAADPLAHNNALLLQFPQSHHSSCDVPDSAS